jgi:amidase
MMNGSNVLEGLVLDVDATIVTRILDAGGEIVGKAVCEHLCFSGVPIPGPVRLAVGHKPIHRLVPYTGAFPIELTLDHTRPVARTAGDAARLLEVLAGADGTAYAGLYQAAHRRQMP